MTIPKASPVPLPSSSILRLTCPAMVLLPHNGQETILIAHTASVIQTHHIHLALTFPLSRSNVRFTRKASYPVSLEYLRTAVPTGVRRRAA